MDRAQFTIRRLMIAVAAIGLCVALLRVSVVLGVIVAPFLSWIILRKPSEQRIYVVALKWLIGYYVISTITIPFMDNLWLGEIPLIALVQLPKITFAGWLRVEVVMKVMTQLGLSRGSFSPDYIMARPYGLAIAYLIPLLVLMPIVRYRTRMIRPYRLLTLLLVAVAMLDFIFTLIFADRRPFTIY